MGMTLLTYGNDLLTCGNELLTCGNDLLTCGNNLVSCGNDFSKINETIVVTQTFANTTLFGVVITSAKDVSFSRPFLCMLFVCCYVCLLS